MTPLTPAHDLAPAAWVQERLRDTWGPDGGVRVGAVVPEGFDAYARVFHPVRTEGDERMTWAMLAQRNGRTAHDEMQFHRIASVPEGEALLPHDLLDLGSLVLDQCEALAEILEPFTSTPDRCWFGLWSGYAGLRDPFRGAPTFGSEHQRRSGRAYFLFEGTLEDVSSFYSPLDRQSPNLWWPDDRAWIVATEIDFAWTYVAGTRACIDALLAEQELEALETTVDARGDAEGDLVNR